MLKSIQVLYQHRGLLWTWTLREIKVRYKQSLLGGAWAVLQPFSLMVIFTLVFSLFVRVPTDGIPYPLFAYAALLPWTFFATSVNFGVPSLVNNMSLLTKIYFPREIIPIASVCAGLVDFMLGFVLFAALLLIYHVPLTWALLWFPLILMIQLAFTLSVTLFTAAVNVFYRDIRFVIPLILQLWLYATPVIYPMSAVPDRFKPLYVLNPMVGIIESYRRVALMGLPPSAASLGLSLGIAVVSVILAYAYFKRVEWQFADVI